MTFLPILERELNVRARSRRTYWTRFGVALGGMLICLPQFFVPASAAAPGSIGRGVFIGIVCVGFVLSCCACVISAEAFGVERREGTLPLLLLTRVSSFDILLGKLGAVGLTSLCALLVLLPMLMVPVLAGGVPAAQILSAAAGLLNALFFALAVGLFVATRPSRWFQGAGWALGGVGLAVVVPILLGLMGGYLSAPLPVAMLSPLFVFIWGPDHSLPSWLISLVLVQVLSWGLLARAVAGARRALVGGRRNEDTLGPCRETDSWVRRRWQPLPSGKDAVEWLVWRQRGIKAAIWVPTILGIAFGFFQQFCFRSPGRMLANWTILLPVSLCLSLAEPLLSAWVVSRFFVQARRSGELELLLTTPLGVNHVLDGQWSAWERLVRWPIALCILASLPSIMLRPLVFKTYPFDGVALVASTVCYAASVLLGIRAIFWAGLWFGLKAPNSVSAIAWTAGLARGIPYLFRTVFQVAFALPLVLRRWTLSRDFLTYCIPTALILLYYLWLIRRARRSLILGLARVISPEDGKLLRR